jgi:hypothetical protein
MRRMQMQARASRGGLAGALPSLRPRLVLSEQCSLLCLQRADATFPLTQLARLVARVGTGGGMRPPMGAGGMQSTTEDDEFSVRPTSRGPRMGGRGPLAPVNTMMGFAQPGGMTKEVPAQISQTEQELARTGIATVFDPTAAGAGLGAAASPMGNPSMGLPAPGPRMDTSDIRGLLTRVPPPDTTVQCYIVRKKGTMGMFASYKLYLQESVTAGPGHMNNKFLLSARKRKKQKKSNYLISLDEEDLAKNSGNVSSHSFLWRLVPRAEGLAYGRVTGESISQSVSQSGLLHHNHTTRRRSPDFTLVLAVCGRMYVWTDGCLLARLCACSSTARSSPTTLALSF